MALTLAEAAEYLRCNPEVLRRKARSGDVPCDKKVGGWRFIKEDLDAWIRDGYNAKWRALLRGEEASQCEKAPDLGSANVVDIGILRSRTAGKQLDAVLKQKTASKRHGSTTRSRTNCGKEKT